MTIPSPLEANAYAITYRLLGDPVSARAAALEACNGSEADVSDFRRHWLYGLTDRAVSESVAAARSSSESRDGSPGADDDDAAGLRAALRRRLANATPDERVAGALVHLAGYPPEFAAEVLRTTPEAASAAAAVLAPPPGVDYRDLGDPALTGRSASKGRSRRAGRMRRPHWTTIVAVAVVAAAVVAATQVTGPRPTLGPHIDEGGLAVTERSTLDDPSGGGPDGSSAHLNGEPLTQATND